MSEQRLTFVRFSHFKEWKLKKGGVTRKPMNVYRCKCGNEKMARREHVRSGKIRSCGCLHREVARRVGLETKNLVPLKKGSSEIQRLGGKATKGRKSLTEGKVFIKDYPNKRYSTGRFVTPEEADAEYYGLDGEVNSLKGQRWKQGDYRY